MASARSGGPSPLWKGRWLVVLGIIAVLPLAALAGYVAWQDQQLQRRRAHDQMLQLSVATATSAEEFAVQVHDMLVSLAREPAIVSQESVLAQQVLANHLAAYPNCANMWVARADGSVYADPHATPGAPPASIAGEPYFQEAMQSGGISIHTLAVDSPDGHRTRLVFCVPVVDLAGRPSGTVQALYDPAAVRALTSPAPLPAGASVVLVDADDTIILHSSSPERWSGRRVPASQAGLLRSAQGSAQEGVFLDEPSVIGVSAVDGTAWQEVTATSTQRALAGWQSSIWGLGAAFAVALGAALFLGVRTATVGEQGWQRQDFLASLVESASVGVAVASGPEHRIEFANPVYCRITGGQARTIVGRPLRDVLPAEAAEAAESRIDEVYRTGHGVRAREVAVQSGDPPLTTYWDVDYLPLRTRGRHAGAVLMLAMPVTERVHARRETEALARQAEERAAQLQAVLGAISDVVLVYDANGNLAFVNDAAARLAGIEATPEEVERLSAALQALELYWPDGRPITGGERQRPRALGGEVIVGEEFMYRPPAGGPLRWVRSSAAPVRDREGQITGAVVTAGDITAQKEAQAERDRLLREVQSARENLRIVINRLPDGVLVVDTAQRVTLCNEAVAHYVGHDVTGMPLPELRREHGLVMPDGQPFPPGQAPIERAMRGEVVTGVEARILHLNGHIFEVLESTAPLYDGGDRIAGAVVALTDITDLRQAEAERERLLAQVQGAQRYLQTLLDRLPDGVAVLDSSLHVTLANDASRELLGRDIAGLSLADLDRELQLLGPTGQPLPPEERPVQRMQRGEVASGMELGIVRSDGSTVDILIGATPLYDHDITTLIITLTDITDRKRAEAERERLLREVQRAREDLYTVVDRLPDWVMVFDASLRVTLSNEALRRESGRDLAGMPVEEVWRTFDFMAADGWPFPPGQSPVQRAVRGETVLGVEVRAHMPDDTIRYAIENAAPLYDPDGRIYGAVVVQTDITAQKVAEAERERLLREVQRAREDLYTIVDRLPDWVMVFDASLHVTLSNEALRRATGRDLAGMTAEEMWRTYEFMAADGRPFPPGQTPSERALRGETVLGVEVRVRLADNLVHYAIENTAPLYDPDGRLYGVVVVQTDITAQKVAEAERERLLAEVESAREKLQTTLNQLPDVVIAFDRNGRLILCNNAVRRYLGREPVGMSLAELESGVTMETVDGRPFQEPTPLHRAMAGEAASGMEMAARLPDGRRVVVRISAAPLYGPGRAAPAEPMGAVLSVTDITARKQAEAERERLLAEVQAARGHLQTVIDRLPDWVLVLDAHLRVTLSNEAIRRQAGRELAGMTVQELWRIYGFAQADGRPFPPGESPGERAMRGETATNVETLIRLPDGSLANALESAAPLFGPDEHIYGIVVVLADITALRQAQAERERLLAEVQAARRNLETVLHDLPNGVLVVDTALRVTLANDTAERSLGPDVAGRSLTELDQRYAFQDAEGRPVAEEDLPVQRALSGEPVTGMELRATAPDGTDFYLLASAVALRDALGRITGAVLTTTDITAQKQAQAELQAARQNLQTIIDQLPDGVLVVDAQERVVLINDAIRNRIRPYAVPDPVGQSIHDLRRGYEFADGDGKPFPEGGAPLERALRGEVVMGAEANLQLPGGQRLSVLESAAPLRAPDGYMAGAVVALTDITARRQAQAERERLLTEVQAAREELRGVVDRLPDGVLVIDPTLHITLCNETVMSYIGRDVTGEPVASLWRELHFTAADHRPFPPGQTPVERALRGETVIGVEVSLEFPGGRHIDALDSAAAVYNPDGSVREVAMVFTDITPLKELDRAKDEFISFAAHELRTPLTALKGHTQILQRRAERAGWAENDQRSLRTIDSQVDRLNDLIGRLLNVSRIRLGRLQLSREPTDLVGLAHEVAENLQVTTKRHRIRVQAEVPELVGNWDPSALRQVLTNLIGNAIRYANPGPIDVRIRREDGQAVLSVTDYGPGIPPERQAQIFEAFRPGAAEEYRRAGGLGLGLYISRGIVEAHGGHIEVESEVGVGTTFTVSLPVSGRR